MKLDRLDRMLEALEGRAEPSSSGSFGRMKSKHLRSRAQSGFNSNDWMRFANEDAQKYKVGMRGLLMNKRRSFANIG